MKTEGGLSGITGSSSRRKVTGHLGGSFPAGSFHGIPEDIGINCQQRESVSLSVRLIFLGHGSLRGDVWIDSAQR